MDSSTDETSKASAIGLDAKPAVSDEAALAAEKAVVDVVPYETGGAGADLHDETLGGKKHLSKLALMGMSFAILNTWSASSISIYLGLIDGGPASIVWGMLTATLFNLSIAASLSELCHVYPTAGECPFLFFRSSYTILHTKYAQFTNTKRLPNRCTVSLAIRSD